MDTKALTLTGLLQSAAEEFPDRRAISVTSKFEVTHSRLQELIDSAAAVLRSAGVSAGDVVALTFPNSIELVIMFLAIIKARATAAPLNSAYTQEEFEFYLSDSESKLLLTDSQGNNFAQKAASKLNIPHSTVSLPDPTTQIQISLPPKTQNGSAQNGSDQNDQSDVALFLHTSGTTSRPKGVPLTQQNLAASVRNIKSVYQFKETDSTVVVLPLFHVHGLLCGLLAPLSAGGTVALPASGRFSASTFWSDMRACDATWYTAVPTIHQILLDRHSTKPEPNYPKLRFIRSCSASLAPSILAQLESSFKAPVLEAYAMTEASHLMTSNLLPENGLRKPGSVGKPIGQELAILDEEGKVKSVGEAGEVCIRGANVTKGYKNNEKANEEAFKFEWFHTGDLGYLDEDGYVCLVGRIKELINRGGEKISPIEVDSVLLAHPDIAQAVAFGVPDSKYGEEINCAVIPREGVEITEADVAAYCKKNLAAFKVPKKIFLTNDLPKTATGKIQRRIVAQHFMAPAA
ncbi:hypothetical protein LUZ60_012115 [Juncus effusus]|nr:hypothetical protein LUZ60_012115 [Juncus effusus]